MYPVTITPSVSTVLALLVLCALLRWLFLSRSMVRSIRGPASPSWMFGHELSHFNQEDVGTMEFSLFQQYGSVVRIKGCFGEDRLLISDAKALQHIFHTSGYRYPKSDELNRIAHETFGNGLVTVAGVTHQRQRKILNPAFSTSQLKTFSSLFQRLAAKFSDRMRGIINEQGEVANLHRWLGRVTLDVIGESAFGYKFGAIDNETNELAYILNHFFDDSFSKGKLYVIHGAMWRRLPGWFMDLISRPTMEALRFLHFQNRSKSIARDILEQNSATDDQDGIEGKDILGILARANAKENDREKLNEDEVLSQMATMILAGHETSASTLSWILYELSRHPADQERVRTEIVQLRERHGSSTATMLTPQDYDSLVFMNAVIKEGLRLHPIVPTLFRKAGQDDIIPLFEPITSTAGVRLTQIPVEKGQSVLVSVAYYNRNPAVWGEDANEWRPERFLTQKGDELGRVSVGVFANLMSFSAGIRSCIGWRFAVMEMQTILLELVENFKFRLPGNTDDIKRAWAGTAMLPMLRSKPAEGTQMPLHVTAL